MLGEAISTMSWLKANTCGASSSVEKVMCVLKCAQWRVCSMVRPRSTPHLTVLGPEVLPPWVLFPMTQCAPRAHVHVPYEAYFLCQCSLWFGTLFHARRVSLAKGTGSNWDGRGSRSSRRDRQRLTHSCEQTQGLIEALQMFCYVWLVLLLLLWWNIWESSLAWDALPPPPPPHTHCTHLPHSLFFSSNF